MDKVKKSCTLHASRSEYAEGGFTFSVSNHEDMQTYGYVACDTVLVEFNMPPREVLVNGAVAAYRAEQSRIRAEAQSKCVMLDEEIQKLLCIEDKSGEAA